MRISEDRVRRIIREELNEQGLLGNLVAGAQGAVQGAIAGAQKGGIGGAVQGAVGGAQSGVAANQKVAQAAATLKVAAARGQAPSLMAKMEQFSLSMYLMDWGNEKNPQAVSRALWAILKLVSIEREKFKELQNAYSIALRAVQNSPEAAGFMDALSESTGIKFNDPRWFPTLADAIVRYKIV